MATVEELMAEVPSGTEPVLSGAGRDELAATTKVAEGPKPLTVEDIMKEDARAAAPVPTPRAPVPAAPSKKTGQTVEEIMALDAPPRESGLTEEGFEQAIGRAPEEPAPQVSAPNVFSQMGTLFSEGIQRDWSRLRSTPGILKGIFAEIQGDDAAVRQYMAEAKAMEDETPQAKWNLRNIKGLEDFAYWLSERFGENALTILATMATAGAGGLVAGAASHGLRLGPTASRALVTGGQWTPAFGLMSAIEAGSTAEELFEATGSTQPAWAVGAGFLKGGLETLTPFLMTRALTKTGIQWGTTLPRGMLKGSLLEASTEGAQEYVDIMALKAHASRAYLAKKFGDPDFSFFGQGPEWFGEAGWRMLEAMAAGGALGGAFGGATQVIERRQERKRTDTTSDRETIIAPGTPEPPRLGTELTPLAPVGEQMELEFEPKNFNDQLKSRMQGMPARDIPEEPVKMFMGEEALQADRGALARAQQMETEGTSPKDIYLTTGWFKRKDGRWRFEVDDSDIFIKPETVELYQKYGAGSLEHLYRGTLGELIDAPKLFGNYPELAQIPVQIGGATSFTSSGGLGKRGITATGPMMQDQRKDEYGKDGWLIRKPAYKPSVQEEEESKQDILDTLVHEIQHWVQDKEGFGRGGNPDTLKYRTEVALFELNQQIKKLPAGSNVKGSLEELKKKLEKQSKQLGGSISGWTTANRAMDSYERLLGEVEARNAAFRRRMKGSERARSFPLETEDIAQEQQYDADSLVSLETGFNQVIDEAVAKEAQSWPNMEESGYEQGPVAPGAEPTVEKKYKGISLNPSYMGAGHKVGGIKGNRSNTGQSLAFTDDPNEPNGLPETIKKFGLRNLLDHLEDHKKHREDRRNYPTGAGMDAPDEQRYEKLRPFAEMYPQLNAVYESVKRMAQQYPQLAKKPGYEVNVFADADLIEKYEGKEFNERDFKALEHKMKRAFTKMKGAIVDVWEGRNKDGSEAVTIRPGETEYVWHKHKVTEEDIENVLYDFEAQGIGHTHGVDQNYRGFWSVFYERNKQLVDDYTLAREYINYKYKKGEGADVGGRDEDQQLSIKDDEGSGRDLQGEVDYLTKALETLQMRMDALLAKDKKDLDKLADVADEIMRLRNFIPVSDYQAKPFEPGRQLDRYALNLLVRLEDPEVVLDKPDFDIAAEMDEWATHRPPGKTVHAFKPGDELRQEARVAGVKVQRPPTREVAPIPEENQQRAFEDEIGDGKVPPVTRMMDWLKPGGNVSSVTSPLESLQVEPIDDLLDVASLLKSSTELGANEDLSREWIEANTRRYAITSLEDGRIAPRLLNSTDLERFLSGPSPRAQLEVNEVRQGTLEPGAITADLLDLPVLSESVENMNRLWFLPDANPKLKIDATTAYNELADKVRQIRPLLLATPEQEAYVRKTLEPQYDIILKTGLRIVPSYGASFNYTGLMEKVGPGPTTTGRSQQVMFLDPQTGVLVAAIGPSHTGTTTLLSIGDNPEERTNSMLVSIDMNKFKPGEVSDFPEKLPPREEYKFARPISPAAREEAISNAQTAIHLKSPILFKTSAMSKGLYLEPKVREKPSQLIVTSKVTLDKLTAAAQWFDPAADKGAEYMARHTAQFRELTTSEVKIEAHPDNVTADMRTVADVARRAVPVLDKILERMGVTGRLLITVSPKGESNAQFINKKINLSAQELRTLTTLGDVRFETMIFNALAHEFGHFVTYHFWEKSSPDMQAKVKYAYEQAKLSVRTAQAPEARIFSGTITHPDSEVLERSSLSYYLTFAEYLAEQMRRYITAAPEVQSDMDVYFKAMSERLDEFMLQWIDNTKSEELAHDMLVPSTATAGFFEYLNQHGRNRAIVEQKIKQLGLSFLLSEQGLLGSPATTERFVPLLEAIQQLQHLFPQNRLLTRFNFQLTNQPETIGQFIGDGGHGLSVIDLMVGSLPYENTLETSRMVIAHEIMHALRYLNLITPEEFDVLYKAALEENIVSYGELLKVYRPRVEKWGKDSGFDKSNTWPTYREQLLQDIVKEEMVAYYIGAYANSEIKLQPPEVQGLLEKILLLLKTIKEKLFGRGIVSKEEAIRRFFSGEMSSRSSVLTGRMQLYSTVTRMIDPLGGAAFVPSKILPVPHMPNVFAAVEYVGSDSNSAVDADSAVYVFYNRPPLNRNAPNFAQDIKNGSQIIGWILMERHGLTTWEPHIESNGRLAGGSKFMFNVVEADLGIALQPAGSLTHAGYMMARLRFKQEMKLYQRDPETGNWYSPNYINDMIGYWSFVQRNYPDNRALQEQAADRLRKWRELKAKVPKEVWKNPLLDKMYALPLGPLRNGTLGSMIRHGDGVENSQLKKMMGQTDGNPLIDQFEGLTRQNAMDSQLANANRGGTSLALSAPQLPMYGMRNLFRQSRFIGDVTPEERRLLNQTVVEADRINWFTRMWYGIKQMAWRNPSVGALQRYVMNVESMHSSIANWLTRADDTAREWDKGKGATPEQRANVSKMLFWLAEMKYRTPAEIRTGAPPRHPTPAERAAQERSLGMSPWAVTLVQRVQGDFLAFLNEVERISVERINRTISDPVTRANALSKLATQMAEFKAKPYFPMTRFGRHTITVRDPHSKDKVIALYAYDTLKQRRDALPDIVANYPGMKIINGVVPESAFEFMGMPTPLIEIIRSDPTFGPTLTKDQLIWLEEFERLHTPDNTFRKRWLPQKQLPGFSMDGFRAYASYFINGSRYLGRAEFGHEMGVQINILRQSLRSDRLVNPQKRAQMVNYVQQHYRYIMEGGKDYAKLKAFVSVWQLGFSVAAAGMNLTQTPHVTWPFLSGVFGTAKASGALLSASKALKSLRGYAPSGPGQYTKAREVLRTWQRVDVGQAAELGAFSEGKTLGILAAGSRAQRWWRNASTMSMWMFSTVEAFNREYTALAAYSLAHGNINAKYKPDKGLIAGRPNEVPTIEDAMRLKYYKEYNKLINPANFADGIGLTNAEAIATLFAREAIDRTQFVYAPYARPTFLRHPLGSVFLVFFGYIQAMTYAFRFNPGMVQYLLVATFLYGLMGAIPGGEDLTELIKAVGRKMFGKDWDVESAARKAFREMTRGTVLDEVGPDLFLHGMSKYGFGLGLLPEGYAIGRFDASANGSLGKLVPGLYEASRAVATGADYKQMVTDVSQRLAGAGFGVFFGLLKFSMAPEGSRQQKDWEQLVPRAAKAWSKAYRYATEGETTRQGGRIVQFDMTDPEDAAAIAWQVIGFTPTKVSNTWDYLRAVRDQLNVYKADKLVIYGQMDRAMKSRSSEAIDVVTKSIIRFNEDVMKVDPSMAFKDANAVRQSILNRDRTRMMQEMHLPNIKGQVPVAERLRDMYPGTARPPGGFLGQRFSSKEAQNTADTVEGVRRLMKHDWRIDPNGRLSEMVEDRRGEGIEDPTGGLQTDEMNQRRLWEEDFIRRYGRQPAR